MRPCPQCGTPALDSHQYCPSCGKDLRRMLPADGRDPYLGMTIGGKFLLRELIGSGGMGKVYCSDQIGVGRTVAVKIMHRHLLGDETATARFTNEARASSHLNHPNSIAVLDFGQTDDGLLYIVMEYLRGRSLDTVLQREFPIPFGRVANILCQAMEALEAAHKLNIIHRDLKPENIFLEQTTGQDFVKVLDFGIAKMLDYPDRSITTPGLVPGTPEYMSPEQARGEPLDPRSDIYSLGVILYELITGSVPFRGNSALITMMAHVQDPVEPPSKRSPTRNIPDALDALVVWALAKRPEDRIQSAGQFREILSAWAEVAGLWPSEEEKRATKHNLLLQYFTKEQVELHTDGETARSGPEALRLPTPTLRALSRRAPDDRLSQLCGRDKERERLDAFVQRRGGRVLRIHGAVGMGKSRLMQHTSRQATKAGLEVIHCRPTAAWAPTPLGQAQQVMVSCLGIGSKTADTEEILLAAAELGVDADDLAGLKELFGIHGHLGDTDPDARRRERATAFRHVVQLAAARRPLLLVCEEIEQYDVSSRELFLSLATTPDTVGLVVSHTPGFMQVWPEEVEELAVTPLDERGCAGLIRQLAEQEVAPELAARVYRATHGQPLFVEQVTYAQAHEGITDPPEKVADLVAVRVERLPSAERLLLQWMAVLSDWVTPERLAAIMGVAVGAAEMERLAARGLLRATPRGYAFAHQLIAMVVYSSIPAEVRRSIHVAVAEHLRLLDAPVTAVAHHSYAADDGPHAVAELEEAGALATRCLDAPAAAQYYSRALEVVRREWGKGRMREADLDARAVELAHRLAAALRQCGDTLAARGVLEETLSVAAGDATSRAGLRLDLGRMDLEIGNPTRAARHLELALVDAEAGGPPDSELLCDVTCALAHAAGLLGDHERASTLIQQALTTIASPTWSTLLSIAGTCTHIGLPERARGYLLDALQHAESQRSLLGKLQVISRMAETHMHSSEWGEAQMRLQQALDLVKQVGDRSLAARMLTDLGRVLRIQGEVEQAREHLDGAARVARAIGWWDGVQRAERETEMLRYAVPQPL